MIFQHQALPQVALCPRKETGKKREMDRSITKKKEEEKEEKMQHAIFIILPCLLDFMP